MAKDAHEIEYQTPITIRFRGQILDTTLGRVIFNEVLPEDFPFVNKPLAKKDVVSVLARVFNNYGADVAAETADKIKAMALEHATQSAVSTGMDDYFEIDNIDEIIGAGDEKVAQIAEQYDEGMITDTERKRLTVKVWRDADAEVTAEVDKHLHEVDTAVSVLALSGARGSVDNIKQAGAMIGVQVDASGRDIELPVKNPYKHGMTPLEAFVVTRGSRYGAISTALKTADSGYLTRRLVDVAQDVFTVPDEGAAEDPGFTIYRDETDITMISFADRIAGRQLFERRGAGPPLPRRRRGDRHRPAGLPVAVRRHPAAAGDDLLQHAVPERGQGGAGHPAGLLPAGDLLHPAGAGPAAGVGPGGGAVQPAHRRRAELSGGGALSVAVFE